LKSQRQDVYLDNVVLSFKREFSYDRWAVFPPSFADPFPGCSPQFAIILAIILADAAPGINGPLHRLASILPHNLGESYDSFSKDFKGKSKPFFSIKRIHN
jgi:hypothetical protein